jgi:CheY-like chemotaxis protein
MWPDSIQDEVRSPWRILIVENDPRQRADQIETFRHWGYDVVAAEAQINAEDLYDSLRADALQKTRFHHIHIVVTDLRLTNDQSKTDISGRELAIELVKEFPQLCVIIMSGYARTPFLASSTTSWCYVGKEAGPEALKSAIEATIEQIRSTHQVLGA